MMTGFLEAPDVPLLEPAGPFAFLDRILRMIYLFNQCVSLIKTLLLLFILRRPDDRNQNGCVRSRHSGMPSAGIQSAVSHGSGWNRAEMTEG
jgi:hypothetical protein